MQRVCFLLREHGHLLRAGARRCTAPGDARLPRLRRAWTSCDCAESNGTNALSFGELEPVLTARGLVPNGTAEAEGGAVIGEPVNLSSQRVELDVQFALPIGCSGTCLESAGVAFTASEPGAFVDAEVGLLLSGSRGLVNVMIGNEVADSFFAGPGSSKWRLVLSPGGSAQVFRDAVPQGRYAFDANALSQARLVAFGRNLGDTTDSAAIAAIQVELAYCDNPQAWSERQPLSVSIGVDDCPRHAFGAGPSIVDLRAEHAALRTRSTARFTSASS